MLVRIAELDIDPAQAKAHARHLANGITTALREEPGVLFLYAVALRDRPHSVRVVEGYADSAAYAAHLQTPHFLVYKAATAGMVTALRLIETDPICLHGRAVTHG